MSTAAVFASASFLTVISTWGNCVVESPPLHSLGYYLAQISRRGVFRLFFGFGVGGKGPGGFRLGPGAAVFL